MCCKPGLLEQLFPHRAIDITEKRGKDKSINLLLVGTASCQGMWEKRNVRLFYSMDPFDGIMDQFGGVLQVEFPSDVKAVGFNGLYAEIQLLC